MSDERTSDDRFSRRRFLQATGGTAAAVAVAGCSSQPDTTSPADGGAVNETDDGTSSAGGSAPETNTLSLINSTITTFDPVAATDSASGWVIQQVFDSLTNYPNGNQTVKSLLAAEYERSDDNLTYTFTLQEGATFHNGDSVTASDLVYSFERLAAAENSRRTSFILSSLGVAHETDSEGSYEPGTLAVEAVDERTVRMKLARPFHAVLEILAYTAFAATPENVVGDVPNYDGTMAYNEFATQNPVGCGPFQFVNWEKGTAVDVERFDDYYGQVASIDGVHWQIIEDTQAAYNYGQNQNADLIPIPSSEYDRGKVSVERTDDKGREFGTYGPMRNGETAQYFATQLIDTFYIGFNMEAVPKPVRQAFAYALDQQLMVDDVFKGRGETAYHFTPRLIYPGGNEAYNQHVEQNYPYGVDESLLDEARRVMEEAGYGPDNMFEVQWTQYQSTTWEDMAKILRDQLQSAHIDMQIEKAPFATLTKRGRQGNLEAYTLGWIADWPAPDNFLTLLYPPQSDTSKQAPISYLNWSSETGDAAQQAIDGYEKIEQNTGPTDAATQARQAAYTTIEEANWTDVGFLPVYHAIDDRFYYDWLDVQPYGGMGRERQMYNTTELGERQ